MDPITMATSVAAILGLISDFKAGRSHADVLEIKDFTEWLATHGHNQVLEELQKNTAIDKALDDQPFGC